MNPESLAETTTYEFSPFCLDVGSRVLLRDGRIVPLPPKVIETLVILVQSHGQVVEKEKLLRAVWPDTYVDENSLMHNISVLRKVLGRAPDGQSYIETVPRRGYRFTTTVRAANAGAGQTAEPLRINRHRWAVGAVLGIAVAITAGVSAKLKQPGSLPLRVTPLTSYPGTEAFPTFSPDGRQVAFAWNGDKEHQFDIYVKTIGVDPPRRLTADHASECHLAWSPDGRWIAYTECGFMDPAAPAGSAGLYVIPASGGARRLITWIHGGGSPFGRTFTWTADGKALIGVKDVEGNGGAGLFVLPVDAASTGRQITWPPPGSVDTAAAISPDGRTLAFVRQIAHSINDIYLVTLRPDIAAGSEPKRLTFLNDFVNNLVWSNDGNELFFELGNDGERGVWRIFAHSGASPKQVPALADAGVHLALSRDGKLAYSRRYWDFDIWQGDLTKGSSNTREWIASTFSDAEPQYSPDGNSIAFQSNRSGAMEIWRSNADGTAAAQVTSLHGESGSPSWSPDSTQIAFDCRLGANVDIYVVDVRNAQTRRLTTDAGVHTTPSWSRDGKWIYFASKRTGRLETWKVPAAGGDSAQVTKNGGFFAVESVDGKTLYYAKTGEFPTSLWRKSLETGKEEQIIHSLRHWSYFAVFDNGIYYIPDRNPAEAFASFQLNFLDFSTGRISTITDIAKWPGVGFSISPDRKHVLFAPSETHGADLMLVENFR